MLANLKSFFIKSLKLSWNISQKLIFLKSNYFYTLSVFLIILLISCLGVLEPIFDILRIKIIDKYN